MIRYTMGFLILIVCWFAGSPGGWAAGGISSPAAAERQLIGLLRGDWQVARAKRCRDDRRWSRTVRQIPRRQLTPVRRWHQRGVRTVRQSSDPRRLCWLSHQWAAWPVVRCIRHHESGNRLDARSQPSGTYRGLYQADRSFELAYGPKPMAWYSRADQWPRWAQDVMGYRGFVSRGGFNPWPSTSRICGV